MYWTNSTVVTTPINPVDTAQEPNQNQYPQLSATEIKKVLSFSGMSDTGKFEAIITNTDTAGLLAMVGISYAELKGILALPNDKPTTAPGISPAFPSTENTGVTSVHDASPPLAPPALAVMHDACLPPKTIDAGADIDAINTPSPATSGMIPHSNPAPLAPAPETNGAQGMLPDDSCTVEFQPVVAEPVPVPENSDVQGMLPDDSCTVEFQPVVAEPVPVLENSDVQGMLPDGPCNVDLEEITQAPADPVDLPPESGSNSLFSVAAMRNVLDFFGMSDAGTAETLEAFTNIYDFFEWFDKLLIMKNAALIPADAGVNPDGGAEQNDGETNDTVHSQNSMVDDVQDSGAKPSDASEKNQSNDNTLPETSAVLLGGPTGPGPNPSPDPNPDPVPEPVPVVVPPVAGPPQVPVVPVPETVPVQPVPQTVPVQPVPQTVPVQPVPQTVPVQPVPAAQLPEAGPLDPNKGAGSNGSGSTESSVSASESNLFNEILKIVTAGPKSSSNTSTSSSFSGWGGFGSSRGSSLSGAGLDSGGGVVTTLVGTVAGRLLAHQISGAESDNSSPDKSAEWLAARDEFMAALPTFEEVDNHALECCDARDQVLFNIQQAEARKAGIETQIENEARNIGNNMNRIAHINTKIFENEFRVNQVNAQKEATRIARIEAQQRANEAGNAITKALDAIRATDEEDAQERAHQADIIIAQSKIISERDAIFLQGEASDNAGAKVITQLQAGIARGIKIITGIQEANQGIENKIIEGQRYIEDLQKYIRMKSDMLPKLVEDIREAQEQHAHWFDILKRAEKLMDELSAFQGENFRPDEPDFFVRTIDQEPILDEIGRHDNDPDLPPIPPSYQTSDTGATHTTTTSGTTFVPHNAHSGSHPAAGPMSFNVTSDTPESHELSVQVEMVHPSVLAGSSTAVLHADTVMHDLPIIHAIIDAWIRTLPASAQISLQGFDILNADQAGPVTLAIQFAPLSGHTVDANIPADAVAILKAAIQCAVAIWEGEQESAAPIVSDPTPTLSAGAPEHQLGNPSPNSEHGDGTDTHAITSPAPLQTTPPAPAAAVMVPLHYGLADVMTPTTSILLLDFATPSSTSEFTDFIRHSHDIPAIQGVLAHWMGSIDPVFASAVVAFEMFDYNFAGDGGIMLQVLVNDMPYTPNEAWMALQNAMQDYLDRPDSAMPDHPAIPDGTTHQALSVVGVAEHSGLG